MEIPNVHTIRRRLSTQVPLLNAARQPSGTPTKTAHKSAILPIFADTGNTVSYTHLDVYKRQPMWRSGKDTRAALIGPGVHASHGMERTHLSGMMATLKLMSSYLEL